MNGPSCAGKTTLQNEIQQRALPNLWVKAGVDLFFDAVMPDINPENLDLWSAPNSIRWVESTQDTSGNKVITLKLGERGKLIGKAMNSAIASYAKLGCHMIVDYIAYDPEWLGHLKELLEGCEVYWVAVRISLKTLESREKIRATSPIGHARSHFNTVYGEISYDLEVDTENESAPILAEKILNFVEEKYE